MTKRNEDLEMPRRRTTRRAARRTEAESRTPTALETVVNAAPDIKTGFDMAAKAVHARRPK
jgi:hypothetical protein